MTDFSKDGWTKDIYANEYDALKSGKEVVEENIDALFYIIDSMRVRAARKDLKETGYSLHAKSRQKRFSGGMFIVEVYRKETPEGRLQQVMKIEKDKHGNVLNFKRNIDADQ